MHPLKTAQLIRDYLSLAPEDRIPILERLIWGHFIRQTVILIAFLLFFFLVVRPFFRRVKAFLVQRRASFEAAKHDISKGRNGSERPYLVRELRRVGAPVLILFLVAVTADPVLKVLNPAIDQMINGLFPPNVQTPEETKCIEDLAKDNGVTPCGQLIGEFQEAIWEHGISQERVQRFKEQATKECRENPSEQTCSDVLEKREKLKLTIYLLRWTAYGLLLGGLLFLIRRILRLV